MQAAVAITGMGAVTAQGIGVAPTWWGVCESRDALQPWSGTAGLAMGNHPLSKIRVAECPALTAPNDLPPRLWGKLSRTQQLACVAVDEALASAGLPRRVEAGEPVGLFMATTVCGMDMNERYYEQYRIDRNAADVDLMRRLQPYEVSELLRRRHGVGPDGLHLVCLTTCVGSAVAISAACDAIALGECDMAIAGGSEALCRVVLSGFHALKVVAPDGCRPFDADRPGITVGEGAGILVLESLDHAKMRGASPIAYIRGTGITCDAHHITAPDPRATQAARAMHDALARATLEPRDVNYINAHGTGTRDNDQTETTAIRTIFADRGEGRPLVSSTKRCTGHTFGAAGAIEAILCAKAVSEGIAPANAGSVRGDPSLDLPIVRGQSVAADIRVAMSTNFAFGGNNTAILIARDAGETAR